MKPPRILVLGKRDRKGRLHAETFIRSILHSLARMGLDEHTVRELEVPPEHYTQRLLSQLKQYRLDIATMVKRSKRYPVRVSLTRAFVGPYNESCPLPSRERDTHKFQLVTFCGSLAGKLEFRKNSITADKIVRYHATQFTKKGKRRK